MKRWQLRGSLAPAVEPLREPSLRLCSVLAPLRGPLAGLSTPASTSVDSRRPSIVRRPELASGADRRVVVIGATQYAVTRSTGAGWEPWTPIGDVPVNAIQVPYLGPVPTPVLLLAAALLAGYLLARLLQAHAGWVGRRWARRAGARITSEVSRQITDDLLIPLVQFDASRPPSESADRADECHFERPRRRRRFAGVSTHSRDIWRLGCDP